MYNFDYFPQIKENNWLSDKTLSKILSQLPKKVLIVHSKWAVREGHLSRFQLLAKKSQIIPYLLDGEPTYQQILNGFSLVEDVSLIIGLGSGNVMDFCKVLSSAFIDQKEFDKSIYGLATKAKQLQKKRKLWLFPSHYSSSSWISNSLVFQLNDYKVSCFGGSSVADKVFIDPNVLATIAKEDWLEKSFDCFAHFFEIFESIKDKDSFYRDVLVAWFNKFTESVTCKDYKSLFYLASFLFSGFIDLEKVEWPIHIRAHAYGPFLKLSHTKSLLIQYKQFQNSSLEVDKLYGGLFESYSETLAQLAPITIQKLDELAILKNPRSASYLHKVAKST